MSERNLWNVPGSTGASGLLLTVLGEFVRPATLPDGASPEGVWTQTLVEVLDIVGVREKAARQAIARLHDRQWLTKQAVGRQTRWSLTSWAENLLTVGAERIYQFGQPPDANVGDSRGSWNGEWLVALASLPEAESRTRYRLTTQLGWIGLGSIGQGIWISPHRHRLGELEEVLDELGMASSPVFVARLTDRGQPRELAARAWDLPGLAREYRSFLDRFERTRHGTGPADGVDPLAELLTLVHRWRYFPSIDPDLPSALLPSGFPAAPAAAVFASRRAELLAPAWERWHAIDGAYRPEAKAG